MFDKKLMLFVLVFSFHSICFDVEAVTFKLKNDSQYWLRARAFDRGQWRSWVEFAPGGWDVFALHVKRTEHDIEIQIWDGSQWMPLYYNHHGSRLFTRVVQVFNDQKGNIYFAWWDEPPGCRGAPPYPGSGEGTCLKPSGWLKGKMMEYAVWVGKYFLVGS